MTKKTAYEEMVDTFDKLVYMVKTTAPHLQSLTNDLQGKIKMALMEVCQSNGTKEADKPSLIQAPAVEQRANPGLRAPLIPAPVKPEDKNVVSENVAE